MKPCPTCKVDIAEFLSHGQINRCRPSQDLQIAFAQCLRHHNGPRNCYDSKAHDLMDHHPHVCDSGIVANLWETPWLCLIGSVHEAPALRRGMVDVIAKLQEAARKAAENAERLEKGEGAAEEEDEEAAVEAEAEADEDADVEAEPADTPAEQANGSSAEQPAGACQVPSLLLLQQRSIHA